jgi:D-3-phosphoglycerate dehydrogenase
MDRTCCARIIVANRNIPTMVSQITAILAENSINISNMLNRNKNEVAYNIIDTDQNVIQEEVKQKIEAINGVLMVRVLLPK